MGNVTVPAVTGKEEEKQQSSVLDGIDPVEAVLEGVTGSWRTPACNPAANPNVAAAVPGDATNVEAAVSEGSGSVLSEIASGVGDAVAGLLDGI